MVRLGRQGSFSFRPFRPARKSEVALPLINVVFLLLVFLLMVGTIREPIPESLAVAATREAREHPQASNTLILAADGSLRFRGRTISPDDLPARLLESRRERPAGAERVTIVADRRVPAERLLDLARIIAAEGIDAVSIVTMQER